MAKPNYQYEKRQKDLAKQRKKQEKEQEKAARKAAGKTDTPDGEAAPEVDVDAVPATAAAQEAQG
jgi:hypothetical protein